ncbi:multicopper oxidase family protein [Haladaptatus sp. CMSO5]|uniref:multicopper oxidase family protein n=1 Tax=Haladaptatus sp. CMSO5 TaxID=3120514 RepID=UPI002FCE19F0
MSSDPTRRTVLKAAGSALTLPALFAGTSAATTAGTSPELEKYVQPLPIPTERTPDGRRNGAKYYEIPIVEFTERLHPDLPKTTLWGFDGQYPGPIINARRNERLNIRFDNSSLPEAHLLSVDERIAGTKPEDYPGFDGLVPEVRTVTHVHGLNVEPESDGQADMWTSPDGSTGPRFAKHVHEFPNRQSRMTTSYHDHTRGISRLNNYAGLVGFYFITSQAEERLNLPSGEYDVPLMLHDRTFNEDGSLSYPDSFEPNVAGDTAVINGAVWPYMEVEPRRYRLRFVNTSNGRTYNLHLENDDGADVPTMHQFAAGHGFLDRVVPIGPDGDLHSLLLAPFERGDVIVDFSAHAGETITLRNDAPFPFTGLDEHGDHDGHMESGTPLPELMQIRVAESNGKVADESADPTTLDLPTVPRPNEKAARKTRHMTMTMTQDEFGRPLHLLNNRRFNDETTIKPHLGTTEIWNVENKTMHTHPLHLHLVHFDVLGRGPDGTDEPAPNERVGKDVVRVNPGETVRILVKFGDFVGQYPWHCHVLEHEDHEMMRPFEVVRKSE